MNIYKFTVGNFEVNNYLIHPVDSPDTVLIDAGEDTSPILAKIEALGLQLKYLIVTHGHADHIAGNSAIIEKTDAQLLIHALEEPYLTDPNLNLSAFLGHEVVSPPANRLLKEGDKISLDGLTFQVLHTPGHSPGSVSLMGDGLLFSGDTLFCGGVGRTDLPGGSWEELERSIREKIFTLPVETLVLTGHGPSTTVDQEMKFNPFIR